MCSCPCPYVLCICGNVHPALHLPPSHFTRASDFGHCRVFKKHIFTFKMSTLTTHYGNINLAPWIPQTSLLMGWEVYMCRWHKLSEMISLWTISIFNDLAMQITTRDAPFDVAFLCLCDFLAPFWWIFSFEVILSTHHAFRANLLWRGCNISFNPCRLDSIT